MKILPSDLVKSGCIVGVVKNPLNVFETPEGVSLTKHEIPTKPCRACLIGARRIAGVLNEEACQFDSAGVTLAHEQGIFDCYGNGMPQFISKYGGFYETLVKIEEKAGLRPVRQPRQDGIQS